MRAFAVGVFVLGTPVWSEDDALVHAVGFALTGTNDVPPKVIGKLANCVFAINYDLFHLNNIYADRIKIQAWQDRRFGKLEQGVTVELEGGETVFETTVEPPKDDGSELTQHMRAESPNMFTAHQYAYTHYRLHLSTNNLEGVKRAWQYIYSHGCTSKQAS